MPSRQHTAIPTYCHIRYAAKSDTQSIYPFNIEATNMGIPERELEENEAKLDNILHKIIEASRQVQDLRSTITPNTSPGTREQCLNEINTLAQIIENLAILADDIDIKDEQLTAEAEREIKQTLDDAITRILTVRTRVTD